MRFGIYGCPWQRVETEWRWLATQDHANVAFRACMHVRRCACACNLMLGLHSRLRWETLWLHCKWLLTITYSYECLNNLLIYVLTELQATNFVLTVTPNDQFGGWIFFAGDLHQNTSIVLQSENTGVFWRRRHSYTQRSDYFFPSQKNPYPLEDTFSDQQLKRGTYRLIVESVSQGVVSETSFYYKGKFRVICSHSFLSCLLILYQEGKRLGDLHCARTVFVRRKDSETLHASDYDVLCWYCLALFDGCRPTHENGKSQDILRLYLVPNASTSIISFIDFWLTCVFGFSHSCILKHQLHVLKVQVKLSLVEW